MNQITKTISIAPDKPNVEVFGDITLMATAPYDQTSVTILVEPDIGDYQENADQGETKVRQVMQTQGHDISLKLDVSKKQKITVDNKDYEVELVSVNKRAGGGDDFEIKVSLL